MVILESRNGRNGLRSRLRSDANGVADEADESPDSHHHEESDETPNHELLAGLMSFLACGGEDELDQAPEEYQERYRHYDRQSDVYQSADGAQKSLKIAEVLGEGDRRSEGQCC